MGFCPYYDLQCPHDSSCEAWKSFGCSACYTPGIPAIFTDTSPPRDPVDCFIVEIFSGNAKISGDILIIYALASDGSIHLEDDITKFAVHLL